MQEKEQAVISYFPSSTKAQAAVDLLAAAGFTDTNLKRTSRYGVAYDPERNDALNRAETLTGLTLFSMNTSHEDNASSRILMGSDPSVSGFSLRGYGMAGGYAFSVITFVPESKVEEAVNIIKQAGGEV
ncbi:MAG TPA: hypothetical protein PKA28_02600 [Methylomusa anaerophila]|uniref:Uncharacterized protein n=1 Tax=Methylomusa anaerophila TaxID=1930071 RepID=A0A348AP38_9FIRM|nr:hypothetical protein [Methylomusa anaerophila]BBB92836.1 hypothetical protein MAMMFC1_03544 [Methylomusa anaerophila]HML87324.1 hypothetical protein [Methylomusa anaerophila]